jgi:hypothetical protein
LSFNSCSRADTSRPFSSAFFLAGRYPALFLLGRELQLFLASRYLALLLLDLRFALLLVGLGLALVVFSQSFLVLSLSACLRYRRQRRVCQFDGRSGGEQPGSGHRETAHKRQFASLDHGVDPHRL